MAYSDTLKLVVGDTLPQLNFTLKDSNAAASGFTLDADDSTTWEAVNLTDGVVKLRIRKVGSTVITKTITATLTGPTNGQCAVSFPTETWTELEYTTSGGGIQTVQDFIKFKVREDFD